MSKQFLKLQAKLNEIQTRLNEVLRDEFIDINTDPIEDVELKISVRNFIPQAVTTKLASLLRKSLKETLEPTAKVTLKDVASAQVLLKLDRDHELAIKVLTKALERQIQPQEAKESVKEAKESKKLAIRALSECASEITKFNRDSISENFRSEFNLVNGGKTNIPTEDGNQDCDVDDDAGIAYCDDFTYTKNAGDELWRRMS
jgi:hypothetical protein